MKYRLVRYTLLDLLSPDKHTDIPSKYFLCIHNIFKTSSRHVFKMSCKMSSRHLCKMSLRLLERRKIVTLKTSWRRLQEMSWRCLEDVFKTNKRLLGEHQSSIDCLIYASIATRPDLSSAVGVLSQRLLKPGKKQWIGVNRIFHYIKGI